MRRRRGFPCNAICVAILFEQLVYRCLYRSLVSSELLDHGRTFGPHICGQRRKTRDLVDAGVKSLDRLLLYLIKLFKEFEMLLGVTLSRHDHPPVSAPVAGIWVVEGVALC